MSPLGLSGRRFLDRLKHDAPSYLKYKLRWPCPPYSSPLYWDRAFKDLDPTDVLEWGGFDLQDGLLEHRYEVPPAYEEELRKFGYHGGNGVEDGDCGVRSSTFRQLLDVSQRSSPEEAIEAFKQSIRRKNAADPTTGTGTAGGEDPALGDCDEGDDDESIVLLGCGNSKFGEQLLLHSFVGPVLNVDASNEVIRLMNERYRKYFAEASVVRMNFLADDALTGLTALERCSAGGGVVDKGFIDSLHCEMGPLPDGGSDDVDGARREAAARDDPIRRVVESAHRILRPSRPFVFFSRSEPKYLLRRTLDERDPRNNLARWKDVQVRSVVDLDVLIYRFVKADEEEVSENEERVERVSRIVYKKKSKRRR